MPNKKEMSVPTAMRILRASYFCQDFMPVIPIIILLYTQKGITVGDFFLIQGIFRLAAFLWEIPSGYLSDRFSRRHVLIFGAIIHTIGCFVLSLAYGFWQIVLGEALFGIACALFSGTLEAYTYDLLKRNNTQKHFLKEMGSVSTWGATASFLATIIGPQIYQFTGGNGPLLFWITTGFGVLQMILLCLLPELTEVIRKKQKNKSAFMDAIGITYNTMKNPKLRNFIIFPALFAAFTISLFWMVQTVMDLSNVPVWLFGFYIGANHFSRILSSRYAYKVCNKFGEKTTSMLAILILTIGITMGLIALHAPNMTTVYIAVAIMACAPAVQILNNLQYNTLIHHDIESKERGTVLSTRAMVSTLFGATMLAGIKYLYDYCGADTTLLTMLFATVLLLIALRHVLKYLCCTKH